jgi:glycosyltransferase involved in cell wall biosynthesis
MISVDVAVPSYQYGHYLRGCVTSILAQRIPALRVLIIDNASTDDSLAVARRLAAEDRRVEVVAHPRNLGPHASFNEAVDWARADYFMILCADDLLAPGALRRACALMERHPTVGLTYGRAIRLAPGEPVPTTVPGSVKGWTVSPGHALLERFCRSGRCHIQGPDVVVRTAVQKQVGHYRPSLSHSDDFELWMRFAAVGDVAETDAVQAIARVHPQNQCAQVPDIHRWTLEFEKAFESFFAHEGAALPDARRLRGLARVSLAEQAYWSGLASLSRGEIRMARTLLGYAVRRCPRLLALPPLGRLRRRPDAWRKIMRAVLRGGAPVERVA